MNKPIGLDIDGCLSDFNEAYIDLCIETTGKDMFPPRPFDILTWYYPEHYGYSDDDVRAVWAKIKKDPMFWFRLMPYPDTMGFLDAVYTLDADVYFVTSRVGMDVKGQTEAWLSAYGYPDATVLISEQKGMVASALQLQYYIDDKQENCYDVLFQSPQTKGYMLARSWNKQFPGIPRIDTLTEFLEVIRG